MPGGGDLPLRIASLEQSGQLALRGVVETLLGEDEQLASPVERVGLPAAVFDMRVI